MMYYSYEDFAKDAKEIKRIIDEKYGTPDAIIAVARGGLTLAHFLSISWNLRSVYSMNAISYSEDNMQGRLEVFNVPNLTQKDQKVLIVDEIVDSGKSLKVVLETLKSKYPSKDFISTAIFQKENTIAKADVSLKIPNDWIDFFWEVWHK